MTVVVAVLHFLYVEMKVTPADSMILTQAVLSKRPESLNAVDVRMASRADKGD